MDHSLRQQQGFLSDLSERSPSALVPPRWAGWDPHATGNFPATLAMQPEYDGIAPLAPRRNGLSLDGSQAPQHAGASSNEQLREMQIALQEAQQALNATEKALAMAKAESFRAQHGALHDAATGLPNRKLFLNRLEKAIAVAERHRWNLAVLFLDLDQFKRINDTWGHAAGDHVINAVALRLMERTRDEDTVCRYGGDEFLFLLMNPGTEADIRRIADAVFASFAQAIDFGGQQLRVGASIGIAAYPDHGLTGVQLIRNADLAMYRAKTQRKGPVFFS